MERFAKRAGLRWARAEPRGRWDREAAAAPNEARVCARGGSRQKKIPRCVRRPPNPGGQEKTRDCVRDGMRLSRSANSEVSSRPCRAVVARQSLKPCASQSGVHEMGLRLLTVDDAGFHYEGNFFERGDVVEWIAGDCDDVCLIPGLQHADFFLPAQ